MARGGGKAAVRRIAAPLLLLLLAASISSQLFAADRAFTLSGVSLTLEDVSSEVEVRYRSMRLNRAVNVWNVEVTLTNKGTRTFRGPFVLLIDSFAGTTGPQQTEGVDDSTPSKPLYDLSNWVPGGTLASGTNSLPRTLSFGVTNGSPRLTTKVYAKVASGYALGLTRSLNEVGQPLPGAQVVETGPRTATTNQTDGAFGLVTLGQTNGQHVWKFSSPDHLPVWRTAALGGTDVTVLPNPRLTRRSSQSAIVTPVQGGQLATADGSVQVTFVPGVLAQNGTAVLTPLTAQTLPALLPLGWSPLQAFWLELTQEPASPVAASLRPWGPFNAGDTVVLARWDAGTLQWIAAQMLAGNGANAVATSISGSGAYCLLVADSGGTAPPAPQTGQPISPSNVSLPPPGSLSAAGSVNPASSPASRVAELVTASAQVIVTNQSGPLPSGVILRCEVMENYRLRDGSRRLLPQYENFIIGYQRPGDNDLRTLQANFPLRPLLLLGSDELEAATVSVDVLNPAPFGGGILDATGGQAVLEGIRLLAGAGDLAGVQAVQIHQQNPTNFSDLAFGGANIVQVFELGVAGVAPDRRLTARLSGLPANSLFVLARVVSHNGLYGLEPRERLATDSNGNLATREPASGERLPGVNSAGQYVLLGISAPQGLVTGVARNSTGQPAPDLPVRIVGQPWLTFSGAGGAFRLIASVGSVDVAVTDLTTGDTGQTAIVVADPQAIVNAAPSTAAVGPTVISINPTNAATLIPRVTPIVIHFSEPINPGSLGTNGIQLVETNGQPVAASMTLNLRSTIVTLLPTSQLAPSTLHTVVLSTNIADFTGLRLEGANSFTFTTESDALDRIQTAQVVSYEPTNGVAVMTGSPGIAEPEAPVILVNETTGRSATILSKPDGSFTNSIEAGADDFLSAVIVNKNGTRNTIPVSRQIFRDGSVGLFKGGGILEAQSDGGPVQVMVEPGSITTKATFKLAPISLTNVLREVNGVQPEGGKILGGIKFTAQGETPSKGPDVVFPVNVADLGLPAGTDPTNATFALAVPREIDGVTVYEVIDRMVYENGKLATHSLPFLGLLGLWEDILIAPLLLSGGQHIIVAGSVRSAEVGASGEANLDTSKPLPGALVTFTAGSVAAVPGRLRAGTTLAVARGPNASFSVLLPIGTFDSQIHTVAMRATHPRFPGISARRVLQQPTVEERLAIGNVLAPADLIFLLSGADANDTTPPRITISHSPVFPPAGGTSEVRIVAFDDFSIPNVELHLNPTNAESGVSIFPQDVSIVEGIEEALSSTVRRRYFDVSCTKTGTVVLSVAATDAGGNFRENPYTIRFGGAPPAVTNSIPVADPNDHTGPMVIFSSPPQRSRGLGPGQPIILRFSEPIARSILENPYFIYQQPLTSLPLMQLSDDQQELTLLFNELVPDTDYTLVVTPNLTDLNANHFDQDPTTSGADSFELNYRTAARTDGPMSGIQLGGGAASKGIYTYALERRAGLHGAVFVYDMSTPSAPQKVAEIGLPGSGRDLLIIPHYSYKLNTSTNTPVQTNDLLVVVGGDIGSAVGQFLWVIDISQPTSPKRVAARQITLAPSSAVIKVIWSPPTLAYLEFGDPPSIGLVNLQAFILGEVLSRLSPGEPFPFPPDGGPGLDKNGDGDFVDEGEQLPFPSLRAEFAGKVFSFIVPDTDQAILDCSVRQGGSFVGVLLDAGHVMDTNGFPSDVIAPPAYRTLYSGLLELPREAASFNFTNGRPTRLTTLFNVPVTTSNQTQNLDLALVSVTSDVAPSNRLVVLDITLPTDPRFINEIPLPQTSGGPAYSMIGRDDGVFLLATPRDVILIDLARLGTSTTNSGPHPAVIGILPGAGSGSFTYFGSASGLNAVNQGGKNRVIQTAPTIDFVSFPRLAPFVPSNWVELAEGEVQSRLDGLEIPPVLIPSRFRSGSCASSTLDPPQSVSHYYVLLRCPGSAGASMDLSLESLNWAQEPLRNRGFLFPPVHSFSQQALSSLEQVPAADDAPVRPCRAWRLSSNPASDLYNFYLSRPIVVVYEELSKEDIAAINGILEREILWSGDFTRVSLDPSLSDNSGVGKFAGSVDILRRAYQPGVSATIPSFPADYLQSPNPGPVSGWVTMPQTLNAVSAHNAELSINTVDMELPGRRLELTFRRNYSGQGFYDGPFGRGWDFNFNQRIVELKTELFPSGSSLPLVTRSDPADNECAGAGDLLFYNGAGRVVIYKYSGTNAPPEVANDPLVRHLGWIERSARFYLPPTGAFNLIFKFKDGHYARLETDGTQYWYNSAGRLIKAYDRYDNNSLEMVYNARGELIRILDELRRPLEIGYWRLPNDPDRRPLIDDITSQSSSAHRICRLVDYSHRDVLFFYDGDGLLERREGPKVEAGMSNSFFGRQITRYIYSDSTTPDRTAKSLVGVIGGEATGTPLVSAGDFGAKGRDTVGKFNIGAQATTISLSHSNSAQSLSEGSGRTTVVAPDGLTSDFHFDAFGHPTQTVLAPGGGSSPLTNHAEYYPNGLLKSVTYPEGNSMEYVYDSENPSLRSRANLVKVTKKPGPRGGPVLETTSEFDDWYNLPAETRRDFNGNIITITLTGDHRDTASITKGTDTEFYAANAFGQMTSHTAVDGVITRSVYDSDGFLAESWIGPYKTAYGYPNLLGLTSDPGLRGLASQVTDPNGVVTTQIYDERNQLVRETRAGLEKTFAYDSAGHVVQLTTTVETNRVLVEDRTHNQFGFLLSSTVRKIEVENTTVDLATTYKPDLENRVKEIIYPSGDRHVMTYDDFGRLIQYSVPGAYTETYGYDRNGNRISKTVAAATEYYVYDGHDRMVGRVTPLGTTVDLTLDNNGNLLGKTVRDRDGNLLSQGSYTVDVLDRYRTVSRARDAGVSTMSYDFNSTNRTIVLTDALGAQAVTFYDLAGRMERLTTPTRTNVFAYDGNGNLIQKQFLENGQTYSEGFGFNDRDQKVKETDNAGNSSLIIPGLDGRTLAQVDRENHTTAHQYTLLGERLRTIAPTQVGIRYTLNTNRQVDSVSDVSSNTLRSTFDAHGVLLEVAQPDNAATSYTNYNELLLPRMAKLPRGITIQSAFDAEGKITNRVISGFGPTRIETYQYDGLQRPTRITDPSGSVGYKYDLFGFIKEFTNHYQFQSNPPPVSTLDFSIRQDADAGGFRSALVYPYASVTITNRRDQVGRLLALEPDAGEPIVKNTIHVGDKLIGVRVLGDNRIALEMSFNELQRPVSRRYTRIADGKPLADVRYSFDKNGAQLARQFVHRAGRTDFFSYDPGDRLIRADIGVRPSLGVAETARSFPDFSTPPGVPGSWSPGAFARVMRYRLTDVLETADLENPDNLATPPFASNYGTPDALLHVATIDGFTRTRDEVGDVTRALLAVRIPGFSDAQLVPANLSYNDLGLLIRIEREDGVTIANEFDQAGLRIRRQVTGNPSLCVPSDIAYLYDGAKLIEERDLLNGAAVVARYFYADDGDELIAGDLAGGSPANLIRHYFLTDLLKSVLAVADSNGQVIERVSYDAWGQPSIQASDSAPPNVARVFSETNTLLVEFTESVLPVFTSTNSSGLIAQLRDPAALLHVRSDGQALSGAVRYEENAPGHPFGTSFRFLADQPLSGAVQLTVTAGVVQDEWNNPNPGEVLDFNVGSAAGTLVYSGPTPASTAPRELARSAINSPFLFQGQVFDYDTGLLYCRARFYDPLTGMFLQRDPAGYADSVNHYAGFANNPINLRDPTGSSVTDWGKTLFQTGSEMTQDKDSGVVQYLFGAALESAGSVLLIGSRMSQGMELLESHQQGTFGLLDRMHGAQLVSQNLQLIYGLSSAAAAIGDAAHYSAYGFISGLAEKRAAIKASRQRASFFLFRKGMSDLEPEAFYRAMEEFKKETGAKTIEVGVRDWGAKAQPRRRNANAGEPGKGVSIKVKSDTGAHVEVDFADPRDFKAPHEHGPSRSRGSKAFNSDIDLYYVRLDGRRANLQESQRFGFLVNREYSKAFKRAGFTGRPNVPIFHGAHVNLPELYGTEFNGHVIDNQTLAKIGHPGEGFSIRMNADGSVTSFDGSRSYLQSFINEANPALRIKQGIGLPQNWGYFP